MIRYALKCAKGHRFDSWFQSADAFETLSSKGLVTCAICGGAEVAKAMMAPRVAAEAAHRSAEADVPLAAPAPAPAPTQALSVPSGHPVEQAMQAYRRFVEENTTYVGKRFAEEARAMHLGEKEQAAIHGEASAEEARALIEDGVPIAPVPGVPKAKRN